VDSGDAGRADCTTDGADGSRWDPGLEDDSGAVLKAAGRQIKLWREAAGLKQAELGAAIGYSEETVSCVERGRRAPKPEFLDNADRVLDAGGKITAMQGDVAVARYPKKVRDLAKLEDSAVGLGAYSNHNMPGLLQTEEYSRALLAMRCPAYGEDEVDSHVTGRVAGQEVFSRRSAPLLTSVLEEMTLQRPFGGRPVLRCRLQRLLEVGRLWHVEIEVMPTDREEYAGMAGELRVLKIMDGTTVGCSEAQLTSRLISDLREVQILEMR
jgi:transcriptional regulator with XRE-family HTH domain